MSPLRLPGLPSALHDHMHGNDIDVDEATMEEYAAGVASTIFKAKLKGSPRVVAVKSSASRRKFSPEPHDIIKEIAILRYLTEEPHRNIVDYLGSRESAVSIELWTPWYPYGLDDLLDRPRFTISPIPTSIRHLFPFDSNISDESQPPWKDVFKMLCKSIIFQIISGLAHLHSLDPPIALRDVKPKNILLEDDGTVKIIDFGIAFQKSLSAMADNLWPEREEKMYTDVATGPFRAPELLFGAKTYDAKATDLWSLGCTVAHFFTPLSLFRRSYASDEDDDDDVGLRWRDEPAPDPFLLPKSPETVDIQSSEWIRESLFDGTMGSIGLAWSTFRLRGTPNVDNWPDFLLLPDASKLEFSQVLPMELRARFPNLPAEVGSTSSEHNPPDKMAATPLDLIHRLLVYPPEARMTAQEALRHPWFGAGSQGGADLPVLLPESNKHGLIASRREVEVMGVVAEWNNEPLGHWLNIACRRR